MGLGFNGPGRTNLSINMFAYRLMGFLEEGYQTHTVHPVLCRRFCPGQLKPGWDKVGILNELLAANPRFHASWPAHDTGHFGALGLVQ